MRYSRMQDYRPEKKGGGKGVVFFVSILVVAAVVYFVGAAEVGNFFSEKVFTPVISWATGEKTQDPAASVEPSSDPTGASIPVNQSKEIEIPSSTVYALQAGAFSDQANAEELASSLRGKGGGGYVLHDGDVYRVLISAYLTEEEAANVQSRLETEEEMSTQVYEIKADSVKFNITSTEEVLTQVGTASGNVDTYQQNLIGLALEFDKGNLDVAGTNAQLETMLTEVREAKANIAAANPNGEDAILTALGQYYEGAEKILAQASGDWSQIEMSAYLKQTYFEFSFAKQTMITSMSS